METKVKIFISYAHEDENIKTELDKHLTTLKHANLVEVWNDREMKAGLEWDSAIKSELQQADIILLLISPDFITSSYINKVELDMAMKKHEMGTATIIPIYVTSTDTKYETYRKINPLPKDGKPIDLASNKNLVLSEIASKIREIVVEKNELLKLKKSAFQNDTNNNEYVKVFLSVASPSTDVQLNYIQQLKNLFQTQKLNLVTLSEWNEDDPIKPIYTLMKECKACVILLIERYYIESGKIKRGNPKESNMNDISFTSPWCHIEATLAYTLQLPMLIIKDKNVMSDGVFDINIKQFDQVEIDIENFEEWNSSNDKKFILNRFINKEIKK